MEDRESLDSLFFELASEDRLNILRELSRVNSKMQEIARKLNLTATEASRQLQRMAKAKLVERLSDGNYSITPFGKLLLHLSSSIEFTLKHKQYFLEHDVWQLPTSFVYRLGELSEGTLLTELNEVMIRWEELIKSAEDHLWVMVPQVMPNLSQISGERRMHGVKLRCINSEQLSETSLKYMQTGVNVERKCLPKVPVGMLITEKEGSILLPVIDGKMDNSVFFGNDKSFLKWVNDLFTYYWVQSKSWHSR